MEGDYLQYLQLIKWRSISIRLQLRQRIRDGVEIEHDDPLIRELRMLKVIAGINKFSIKPEQA